MSGLGLGPRWGSGASGPQGNIPAALGPAWMMDPKLWTLGPGGIITAAGDAGGSGLSLTAASGDEPVSFTGGPYGAHTPSLRTSNSATALFSSTGGVTGATPFHMFCLVMPMSTSAGIGTGGQANVRTFMNVGNVFDNEQCSLGMSSTIWQVLNGRGTFSQHFPDFDSVGGATATVPWMLEVTSDGTNVTPWQNGLAGTPVAHTLNIASAAFGFLPWFSGSMLDICVDSACFVFGKQLTLLQRQELIRYELLRLGGTGVHLAAWGDSYTSGGAPTTTAPNFFPLAIRQAQVFPHVFYPQNLGHSGKRSDEVLALLKSTPFIGTHVHYWVGVNDIIQGPNPAGTGVSDGTNAPRDAALIYAQIAAAITYVKSLGMKIVVGTLPQWGSVSTNAYEDAVRVALNGLIRGNSGGAHRISDMDAVFGPYNPANFTSGVGGDGGLHPNDAANVGKTGPTAYAALIAA